MPTKTFTPEEITERVREMAAKPIDRAELDAFIETLEYLSPLQFVLTTYRAKLDGLLPVNESLALDTAFDISDTIINTVEAKIAAGQERTQHERLSVKYLGLATWQFSGDADADHRA
jgi:hypothetical protein